MKEKNIISEVKNKLFEWGFGTGAYEFKLARGTVLPFSALANHQKMALRGTLNGFFAWKIADFGAQNPYDLFVLSHEKAFIVVVFWVPRKLKRAVFILIDDWCEEELRSVRKSLTLERACEIGQVFDL